MGLFSGVDHLVWNFFFFLLCFCYQKTLFKYFQNYLVMDMLFNALTHSMLAKNFEENSFLDGQPDY